MSYEYTQTTTQWIHDVIAIGEDVGSDVSKSSKAKCSALSPGKVRWPLGQSHGVRVFPSWWSSAVLLLQPLIPRPSALSQSVSANPRF